jgi:hypothetical protein
MKKLVLLTSALVVSGIMSASLAEAGGRGRQTAGITQNAGSGNDVNVSDKGKIHINQNGNGCRNRCYGDQTFNAGFNNGNFNFNNAPGRSSWGHSHHFP